MRGMVDLVRRARSRTTMRDVAALDRVSRTTVSRTTNDEPRVNGELLERVPLAAVQLRCQPNFSANALRNRDGRYQVVIDGQVNS